MESSAPFCRKYCNLPVFCMGDMNNMMHVEKLGPYKADIRRINAFCDHVKQCGSIDLGYNGPAYTWSDKHFSTTPTFQRLDRCLANAEWCMAYPATTVYHLPSPHACFVATLLLFLPFSILHEYALTNLSVLKIGGFMNRTFRWWPKEVGAVLLANPSLRKPNSLLMT